MSALALALLFAAPLMSPQAKLEVVIYHSADEKTEAAAIKALTAFTGPRRHGSARKMSASDLPPMTPQILDVSGKSLTADERRLVTVAKRAIEVEFTYPAPGLEALLDADRLVSQNALALGGVIFDIGAMEIYGAAGWKKRRLDSVPSAASAQFIVHEVAEKDGTVMLDTAGLERFGMRELMIRDAHRASAGLLGNVLNLIVQTVVEGGKELNGTLVIDLGAIRNEKMRNDWLSNCMGEKRTVVAFKPTRNEGLEMFAVEFPGAQGSEPSQRYDSALKKMCGSTDSVAVIEHDARVLAASERAKKALLGKYKAVVQKGVPLGERLMVKAPFEFDQGNEWMWVEVLRWEGPKVTGRLENEPENATQYRAGQTVTLAENDLFDFMYVFADGSFYGNEVGQVMEPAMFERLPNGRLRVKE